MATKLFLIMNFNYIRGGVIIEDLNKVNSILKEEINELKKDKQIQLEKIERKRKETIDYYDNKINEYKKAIEKNIKTGIPVYVLTK